MGLDRLVAGDTLDFPDSVPGYPPADGWTLKYKLTPRFSAPTQAPITLTATTSGTTYRTQASPATTATWVPGIYSWARWVEKSGARQTLDPLVPSLELLADPSTTAQGYDPRSTASQIYDGLLTLYASYSAGQGMVSEYSIAGRMMRFRDSADLIKQLQFWRNEVAREERAAKLKSGLDAGNTIRVRF